MALKICTECGGRFPVHEQHADQEICFTCFHWTRAVEWLERTIVIQRMHHPEVVASVDRERIMTVQDFGCSIFAKDLPIARAHLPIRLVRLECRIVAADVDVVCGKLGLTPHGSAMLRRLEEETLELLGAGRFSAAWQVACVWRKRLYAALKEVREAKRLRDAERRVNTMAGA